MSKDKAPILDVYPVEFYKTAWPIIGKDLIIDVQSFFNNGFMPRSTNATILSLIHDYRCTIIFDYIIFCYIKF